MNDNLKIDNNNLPKHIAIIMDGNGRWAKKKYMPRFIGHKNGVKSALEISKACAKLNIKHLTLYTLSIENLHRPKLEVETLMTLLSSTIKKQIQTMKDNNIKLNIIGFRDKLSSKINNELDFAMSETCDNSGLQLNLALAYSARKELVDSVQKIANQLLNGQLEISHIDEAHISQNLFTKDIPDPDLIIRTGGENRLSNFLLWQSAYSELYFCDTFWPDFKEKNLYEALDNFKLRERRFGTIKNEK